MCDEPGFGGESCDFCEWEHCGSSGPGTPACAAVLECPIEVNIYYRTPERMTALLSKLNEQKVEASVSTLI